MAIVRWSPLWPFDEDFDRMMRDFPASEGTRRGFTPDIDLYQNDNSVVVETALAGVDSDDVDISIENDVLTIKGSMEKKSEVDDKDYWRKEVRSGSFYRQVALPTHVVGDQADAQFENGVLKITIPKAPQAKAKKITVKKSLKSR
ncbi:MAG: Hsp20/alpha crystallin family protein [bacterium]|nr:Hsp20/alpha crystallin family protein [bacterium]